MRIKAKMLLPRPVLDEEGNEIDPREELVKHLLEYKRYKSVISELVQLETQRLDRERRGNLSKEIKHLAETSDVEAELQDLDLFKILKVYKKVLQRYELEKNKVVHHVVQYPYTIEGQRNFVMDSLQTTNRVAFTDMIAKKPEKILVIFNFLAILELLQLQKIKLHLGEGFNNFWIEKNEEVAVD